MLQVFPRYVKRVSTNILGQNSYFCLSYILLYHISRNKFIYLRFFLKQDIIKDVVINSLIHSTLCTCMYLNIIFTHVQVYVLYVCGQPQGFIFILSHMLPGTAHLKFKLAVLCVI